MNPYDIAAFLSDVELPYANSPRFGGEDIVGDI